MENESVLNCDPNKDDLGEISFISNYKKGEKPTLQSMRL